MSAENDPRACSTTPGANPNWWHADDPKLEHAARAICANCPVRTPCLELALTEGEPHGIWGGLDPQERMQLARQWSLPRPQIRPPHGHRTRYVGTRNTPGCRCNTCTAAHARYEHLRRTNQLPEKEPLVLNRPEPKAVTW